MLKLLTLTLTKNLFICRTKHRYKNYSQIKKLPFLDLILSNSIDQLRCIAGRKSKILKLKETLLEEVKPLEPLILMSKIGCHITNLIVLDSIINNLVILEIGH